MGDDKFTTRHNPTQPDTTHLPPPQILPQGPRHPPGLLQDLARLVALHVRVPLLATTVFTGPEQQ